MLNKDKQLIYDGIDFGLGKNDSCIPGSYITFRREYAWEVGKVTKVWTVMGGAELIGRVRWFGRWRKYSFFPAPLSVYEEVREIAFFCETATRLHKAAKKASIKKHDQLPCGQV